MRRAIYVLGCWVLVAAGLGGCQRAVVVEAPNPFLIDAREYDRIYEASRDVLRDYGFRVARQDYRFGQVSTDPQGSPTAVEFWQPDNTTAYLAGLSTLSDVRRTATVSLAPAPGSAPASSPTPAAAPATPGATPTTYLLRVEVQMERRQLPTRRLTGSAGTNVFSSLDEVPTELRQRGIEASYWEPLGRDPYLEQRLLRDIVERSLEIGR